MLAKLSRELPEAPGYFYEPKWDGFRCIVFRDGEEVILGSRNERPLTRYFPEVVESLRENLPERCVLDGEVVVVGPQGLDFDALSQRIHPAASRVELLARTTPASYRRLRRPGCGKGRPSSPALRLPATGTRGCPCRCHSPDPPDPGDDRPRHRS